MADSIVSSPVEPVGFTVPVPGGAELPEWPGGAGERQENRFSCGGGLVLEVV